MGGFFFTNLREKEKVLWTSKLFAWTNKTISLVDYSMRIL